MILYFEEHYSNGTKKCSIHNCGYIITNQIVTTKGYYCKNIVATPTKLVTAFYFDLNKFIEYLESINYPYNDSISKVDKIISKLVRLSQISDVEFSETIQILLGQHNLFETTQLLTIQQIQKLTKQT